MSEMQLRLREEYDVENIECVNESHVICIIGDVDLFYSYTGDMYSYGLTNSSVYKNYFTVEDAIATIWCE